MKVLLLTLFIMLTYTSHSSAEELKTYRFTKSFIDCVKKHSSDADKFTRPGSSDSALMNGTNVIDPRNLDGTYWNYMDCLSKSNSNTQSEFLDNSNSCSGKRFSIGNREMYMPPAKDGKVVSLSNSVWLCQGGGWKDITNSVAGDKPALNENKMCEETSIKKSQCEFNLPLTKHGQVAEYTYGKLHSEADTGYYGKGTFNCSNGEFIAVNTECRVSSCADGEEVRWAGFDSSGQSAICKGTVNSLGIALFETQASKLYPTEDMARERSRVVQGKGVFSCVNSKWESSQGSICELKDKEDLVCFSKSSGNGSKLYYCQ